MHLPPSILLFLFLIIKDAPCYFKVKAIKYLTFFTYLEGRIWLFFKFLWLVTLTSLFKRLVTSFKDRIDDDFHVVCYVGFRILKLEHNFGTAVTDDFVRYASNLIKSCSKIVVVAGAGLSTASGIPDFRYSGAFC